MLLHDPQTAAMVDGLRATGARVVWRCHVGSDSRNEETEEAWAFLRHYLERADAFVLSRAEYAPEWMDRRPSRRHPTVDRPVLDQEPRSGPENRRWHPGHGGPGPGHRAESTISFQRRDGSVGWIRPHTDLIADGAPPPPDARLVVQVSRWDRLKDMAGVLTGFTRMAADGPTDTHLMLAGPDVSRVTDDPEGAAVLIECRERWRSLPEAVRGRVHLASIPMDDVDENAMIVNALQRHAVMVVQKSLAEGFGLTVTEAMWKARPVIASRVGGIQDQITDGRDGLLIDDPHDLDALAARDGPPLARPRALRLARRGRASTSTGPVPRGPPPRPVRRAVRAPHHLDVTSCVDRHRHLRTPSARRTSRLGRARRFGQHTSPATDGGVR